MTLDELFKGKAYQRGNALYPTTEEIVLPFVRQVEEYASDFRIQVQKPSDIAVDVVRKGDSTEVAEFNIYSRVSVEAILKDEFQFDAVNDRYAKTIGLVYALDKQQPEVITYSGYLKQLCLNMTIFNSTAILRKNFNDPDFDSIYLQTPIFINRIEGEKQEYIDGIEFMNSYQYTRETLNVALGKLAVQCLVKQPGMATAYSNMVKMLHNNLPVNNIDNHYYNPEGIYTPYDILNAMTSTISKKSDMTKAPHQVLAAFKMFQ